MAHPATGGPALVQLRALIICYADVANDARVSKQIRWLEAEGYRTDILSRGADHPDSSGEAHTIGGPRRRLYRIMLAFLPARLRFRWGAQRFIPEAELAGQRFDLIVVNDHHLLPWAQRELPTYARGPVVLDLHEIYTDNGVGLVHRLLIGPYDKWLLRPLASRVFTSHMTVAEGIADFYRDEYGIARPSVIRNVAPYEALEPSPVAPDRIVLVHHGYAAVERGIDIMLDAMMLVDDRFELRLMVLGDERTLAPLRAHPAVGAGRASFRDPVPVTDVARSLNDCDIELIFFPPRFPNNEFALPNKFFEAIQARLGVIIGHSPEIVPFVEGYGIGKVVDGWEATDLAAVLNSLTPDDVVALKSATSRAARELSAEAEGVRFLNALN